MSRPVALALALLFVGALPAAAADLPDDLITALYRAPFRLGQPATELVAEGCTASPETPSMWSCGTHGEDEILVGVKDGVVRLVTVAAKARPGKEKKLYRQFYRTLATALGEPDTRGDGPAWIDRARGRSLQLVRNGPIITVDLLDGIAPPTSP